MTAVRRADPAPATRRRTLGPLAISRVVDQVALGVGSLLLARVLGPAAFAPVAVLFVVNSLAVQVSDLGVGFAVYRTAPGEPLARSALIRLRRFNAVVAGTAGAAGLVVAGADGVVVAASGLVWALSAEAYVRKAAALKGRATREVVVAEVASAGVFVVGAVAVALLDLDPALIAVVFVAKHIAEVAAVRSWQHAFSRGGAPARSGLELLGQVMTYLVANVDYLLIGWLLGPEQLSLYVVAFRLASAAPAFVGTPITQTAFLELADVGPQGRQAVYDRLLRRIVPAGLVGTAVLLVAAPLLPPVLGSEWSRTAPLLVLLAVAIPWRLLLGTTVALAIVDGRAAAVVRWEALRLMAMAALVATASLGGLSATAAAVSLGTVAFLGIEHAVVCRATAVAPDRRVLGATVVVGLGLLLTAVAVA